MTQKRYNYLPHPISEYGPYRSQPGDSALIQLARKDQACWNLWYLSDGCADTWHRVLVHPSNAKLLEDSRTIAGALSMRYRIMETQFDGVTVRHQVLHLPPSEFLMWFEAQGGYSSLPWFSGSDLAEKTVSLINKGLEARKGLIELSAHLVE
ncbi:MAG: hypothetical protein U1F63_10760 [Chitinivorax sp.]|jgi:hypothetical protein